jgi:hypothetical protein
MPEHSNSAFFVQSPRNTRPNNQRISRQTILSSTRSANHHRTSLAGEVGRSTTRSSFRAAQEQRPPLHEPGQAIDMTARIKHRQAAQGLISEYRRAA